MLCPTIVGWGKSLSPYEETNFKTPSSKILFQWATETLPLADPASQLLPTELPVRRDNNNNKRVYMNMLLTAAYKG